LNEPTPRDIGGEKAQRPPKPGKLERVGGLPKTLDLWGENQKKISKKKTRKHGVVRNVANPDIESGKVKGKLKAKKTLVNQRE